MVARINETSTPMNTAVGLSPRNSFGWWRCRLAVLAALTAVLIAAPGPGFAQADRYGGVWHPGKGTGAFVPISVGMKWADLMNYRQSWGEANSFRLEDIEVVAKGCPSDENDVFATQWVEGDWVDALELYSSPVELQNGIVQHCQAGFQLVDFEIWKTFCEGKHYIALFREGECSQNGPPFVDSATVDDFGNLVTQYAQSGYHLVDFEIYIQTNQIPVVPYAMGVWSAGSATQDFLALDRADFEAEMLAREGSSTLIDMESYRPWGMDGQTVPRKVAAFWEVLPGKNEDDHEVGEVYTKFGDLIYMEEKKRQLVDFEVYPNTHDARFTRVFESYLAGIGGGWSLAVLQSGELVSSYAQGWARTPSATENGQLMDLQTRGPVASVTKFFTALGVLSFAETLLTPNQTLEEGQGSWLDDPFTMYLPQFFGPFGEGVETVTIRELLSQKTGLEKFTPGVSPITNPSGYRDTIKLWLGSPLADFSKHYQYQNIHFELLAIIMEEVMLPQIMSSNAPWQDWMNQEVLAKAGVPLLDCGPTSVDALSYPPNYSAFGLDWVPSGWSCAGDGSGAAMFWASSLDLAKVFWAFRNLDIVSEVTRDMTLREGLGLDGTFETLGISGRIGERLYTKNGGLSGCNGNNEIAGTETLIARFDDTNFDDDGLGASIGSTTPSTSSKPVKPARSNDYIYEKGYLDFDIGIMIHSSANPLSCGSTAMYTRVFPSAKVMLKEALAQPEDW